MSQLLSRWGWGTPCWKMVKSPPISLVFFYNIVDFILNYQPVTLEEGRGESIYPKSFILHHFVYFFFHFIHGDLPRNTGIMLICDDFGNVPSDTLNGFLSIQCNEGESKAQCSLKCYTLEWNAWIHKSMQLYSLLGVWTWHSHCCVRCLTIYFIYKMLDRFVLSSPFSKEKFIYFKNLLCWCLS